MSACETCKKTSHDVTLMRCAKCPATWYCSRDCQKADWMAHKKTCGGKSDQPKEEEGKQASSPLNPPKGLDGPVTKPFTRLENGTWLLDRPEKDVFRLLIDAYRMKVEDDYKFDGDADEDSIYGGNYANGGIGFSRFLKKVEQHRSGALLPAWWSPQKKLDCINFGVGGNDWSDLSCAVEKGDIIDHYGDPRFPMQLRMFAEIICGRGPGGSEGAGMRQMLASLENGRKGVAKTLDMTTGRMG